MMIGFDDSHDIFKSGFGLREVNYEAQRVIFDIAVAGSKSDSKKKNEQIIFTKNKEWRYEGEFRQLFPLRILRKATLANGGIGYFKSIPPDTIVSVCLGAKCPAELELKVKAALAEPRLSNVKLLRASLHESEFRLNYE
jgi:hypothetical protein